MIMENKIKNFLKINELDIRKRGPLPRPFDQKVTPDVLSTVSEAILSIDESFTNNKIIKSYNLRKSVQKIFGKPSTLNKNAGNEYDKFVGQITNCLEFSGIIQKKDGTFFISNKEILHFISISYKNAYIFLLILFKETLKKSNLYFPFKSYLLLKKPTTYDYYKLRDTFVNFLMEYTNIKKPTEPRRIIGKVLNILAYEKDTFGSSRGRVSSEPIYWMDLLYSVKKNSRDIVKKHKNETRKEFKNRVNNSLTINNQINALKKYVSDNYDNVSAVSGKKGIQIHHILKKSDYPQFSTAPENLIPLTVQEHLTKAHPDNNLSLINKEYQLMLLRIHREHIVENSHKYNLSFFDNMLKNVGIKL